MGMHGFVSCVTVLTTHRCPIAEGCRDSIQESHASITSRTQGMDSFCTCRRGTSQMYPGYPAPTDEIYSSGQHVFHPRDLRMGWWLK